MTNRWSMDKGNDGAVISDDSGTIATVSDEMTAWSANANLLFAAPDMLAALQAAESFMSGFEGDEVQDGIDERLASVRAAIAKATGGAAPAPAVTVAECMNVIRAIVARRDGIFDDPALMAMGPLGNCTDDIYAWCDALIAKAEGRA